MKNLCLIMLILGFYQTAKTQTDEVEKFIHSRQFFVGVSPEINVNPFFPGQFINLNIFPVVLQIPITNSIDCRITPIYNLGYRGIGVGYKSVGGQVALPIFFNSKKHLLEASNGFYFAPVLALTRWGTLFQTNIGFFAEPGYHILFDNHLALNIGAQLGTNFLIYDVNKNLWKTHLGLKITIGGWLPTVINMFK